MARLAGHAAVFDRWTMINAREGHFLERVARGAFAKTIREQRPRIRVLFQHGSDPQIGEKPLGPLEELREDAQGLYYLARLLDGVPPLLVDGLSAGLYGASFKFSSIREDYASRPGRSDWNQDGLPERTLREVRLFELGPVTWGAYPEATAGVRDARGEELRPAHACRVEVTAGVGDGSEPLPMRKLRREARRGSRHAAELIRALDRGETVSLNWTRAGVVGRSVAPARPNARRTLAGTLPRADRKQSWRLP